MASNSPTAPAGSDSSQTIKRFQLFDVETYEDKTAKRTKPGDPVGGEGGEPAVKLVNLDTSQGLTVFGDLWYILGTIPAPKSDPKQPPTEGISYLFISSKIITRVALKVHQKNFGIWGREDEKTKYVITFGEDFLDVSGKKESPDPSKKTNVSLIKIWDAEQLLNEKYASIEEYDALPADKIMPKIIFLDRIEPLSNIKSVTISKDLANIAVGFDKGNILLIRCSSKYQNIATCNERELILTQLAPEIPSSSPITNLHFHENILYGTCEKCMFAFNIAKKHAFNIIQEGVGALPGQMDAIDDLIMIFSPNTSELRKFRNGQIEAVYQIKEKAVF